MLRRLGVESSGGHHTSHSEEELRLMLSSAHMSRGGTVLGRQIILNAMDLRNRLVREVMRPRKEIAGILFLVGLRGRVFPLSLMQRRRA